MTLLDIGTSGGLQKLAYSRSLFQAEFSAKAESVGGAIAVSWKVPHPLDALDWSGRIRVLRKTNEWPKSWDDEEATLVKDAIYTEAATEELICSELTSGKIWYFTMFQLRTNGVWVEDKVENRQSAYAYARWGCGDYMMSALPKGWQIDDSQEANNDLLNFLSIFGALSDGIKTDAEHLLSLASAEAIHADLLALLDQKLGWPTWNGVGAIRRRKETITAVDNYKKLGTDEGYISLFQEASGWDASVVKGWKFVMFSNGLYGSVTPDTTDPLLRALVGTHQDRMKYTNGVDAWRSVSGLLFVLTEVPGVSDALTGKMVSRWHQLARFSKDTTVNYSFSVLPNDPGNDAEDVVSSAVDEWELSFDTFIYPENAHGVWEEDLGYTANGVILFSSNDAACVSNTVAVRTYQADLAYI